MLGAEMLIKSLGIDPKQIMAQVQAMITTIDQYAAEQARQGRVLDAIARAHGIEPRDFDAEKFSDPRKEIEHG